VTQKWAAEIGADGYAENAPAAVKLALGLMAKQAGGERTP
jgi:methanogenic corrinoid protein MtbC1